MFYHAIWDPWLIVAQMLLMQCAFYLLSGAWLLLFALAFGTPLRLDALLAPAHMQLTAGARWPALGAVLLQAPALGYLLLPVVGRAKQCLDFTGTVYVFHFLLSSVYQRAFPANWEWWGANAVGQSLMDGERRVESGDVRAKCCCHGPCPPLRGRSLTFS